MLTKIIKKKENNLLNLRCDMSWASFVGVIAIIENRNRLINRKKEEKRKTYLGLQTCHVLSPVCPSPIQCHRRWEWVWRTGVDGVVVVVTWHQWLLVATGDIDGWWWREGGSVGSLTLLLLMQHDGGDDGDVVMWDMLMPGNKYVMNIIELALLPDMGI